MTEKFFIALRSDMIPVVLNGADMSKIAPRHSYIDIKDFKTIKGKTQDLSRSSNKRLGRVRKRWG